MKKKESHKFRSSRNTSRREEWGVRQGWGECPPPRPQRRTPRRRRAIGARRLFETRGGGESGQYPPKGGPWESKKNRGKKWRGHRPGSPEVTDPKEKSDRDRSSVCHSAIRRCASRSCSDSCARGGGWRSVECAGWGAWGGGERGGGPRSEIEKDFSKDKKKIRKNL